jgi:acylphosphatase
VKRTYLIVSGIVQGVGFRYFTKREAESLKLTGFVRNKSDGSVEIEAQGTPEAIEHFLEWAKHGPRNAAVESIEQNEIAWVNDEKEFKIQ